MRRSKHVERVGCAAAIAVKAVSLTILCGYLVVTALYLAPMNPLKPHVQPLLSRTVGHYMAQNWSLFAPTPASDNLVLEAAFLTRADRNDVARRGFASIEPSAWVDLTTPLVAGFHANRLSGLDRFSRPADGAARQALTGSTELRQWSDACKHGDQAACLVLNEQSLRYREGGIVALQRIASAACGDIVGDCAAITHVALRLRLEKPIPWSQRHTTTSREVEYRDLGIHTRIDGLLAPRLYEPHDRRTET